MDREALRRMILDGDDRIRNSVVWRMMSTEQQKLLNASRKFWAADNPATNSALDCLLTLYEGE